MDRANGTAVLRSLAARLPRSAVEGRQSTGGHQGSRGHAVAHCAAASFHPIHTPYLSVCTYCQHLSSACYGVIAHFNFRLSLQQPLYLTSLQPPDTLSLH